jgi:glycosyltransferase involved in cell wall biosynthesis
MFYNVIITKCIYLLMISIVSSPLFSDLQAIEDEKHIVVIIPSFNNEQWYQKNLEILFAQKYENYRVIYIDDCSTDATAKLVSKYINDVGQWHRFELIVNTKRCGALENLYNAIHSCSDDDIIVTYDGDDWFPNDEVLAKVCNAYMKKDVWLTHGTYAEYPGGKKYAVNIPKKIIKKNKFRKYLCPSHLRTFYAWLFKKIKRDDLLYNGKFYQVAWDLAILYPMLEMANERHALINDVLYIYNVGNPISDFRKHRDEQLKMDKHIRKKTPYKRIY